MAKKIGECYRCGEEATSREHVPAKCFFPNDNTFKMNLITVNSCSTHNEDTSLDDEYIRNIIVMKLGNNSLAFKIFEEKVIKSFEESLGLFKSTTGKSKEVQTVEGLSKAFEIDRQRFDDTMKKIVYGLYYKEYGFPWESDLIIMTQDLVTEEMSSDQFGDLLEFAESNIPKIKSKGENPEIFNYNIYENTSDVKNPIVRLKFYEGFRVWVTPIITKILK